MVCSAIALLILEIPLTLSIGISPAKKTIFFEPQKTQTLTYRVLNTDKSDMGFIIYADGPLTPYLSYSQEPHFMNLSDDFKEIALTLTFPENLSYGLHETYIGILQLPKETKSTEVVSVTPSVKSRLLLRVPYPEKYVAASIVAKTGDAQVNFAVPVFNYGAKSVDKMYATIVIKDYQQTPLAVLKTDETGLESTRQATLSTTWPLPVPGEYNALGTLVYDENQTLLQTPFTVGTPALYVSDVSSSRFLLGEINRLDIAVQSNWQGILRDVYADVIISRNQTIILTTKTTPITLEPSGGTLHAYWDTKTASKGPYTLTIQLHYQKYQYEKILDIYVSDHQFSTTPSKKEPAVLLIFALSTIFIILLSIIVLQLLRSKKQKNPKP